MREIARAAGKDPLEYGTVPEALAVARRDGIRVSSPGVVGFGFQPQACDIPSMGVTVKQFSQPDDICDPPLPRLIFNDVQQAFVPDEMHVMASGVWLWTVRVREKWVCTVI